MGWDLISCVLHVLLISWTIDSYVYNMGLIIEFKGAIEIESHSSYVECNVMDSFWCNISLDKGHVGLFGLLERKV
jgi:hypothetical protein